MIKQIKLRALAETGCGNATITENSVSIEISGINGGLKAWLIGDEAIHIGNIVDGRLSRNIDTTKHYGILITQGGRQMLVGRYCEGDEEKEHAPFEISGFNWKKVTGKSFDKTQGYIRFILSNRAIYENYKKHRHYWLGESECGDALALCCENEEAIPLEFSGKPSLYKNGYAIICVDKKTGRLYIPDEKR